MASVLVSGSRRTSRRVHQPVGLADQRAENLTVITGGLKTRDQMTTAVRFALTAISAKCKKWSASAAQPDATEPGIPQSLGIVYEREESADAVGA